VFSGVIQAYRKVATGRANFENGMGTTFPLHFNRTVGIGGRGQGAQLDLMLQEDVDPTYGTALVQKLVLTSVQVSDPRERVTAPWNNNTLPSLTHSTHLTLHVSVTANGIYPSY